MNDESTGHRPTGGLATKLSLHAAGLECEIYEKSSSIRELGVGINLLPHAVKEGFDQSQVNH